jgi:hypothetical protein
MDHIVLVWANGRGELIEDAKRRASNLCEAW